MSKNDPSIALNQLYSQYRIGAKRRGYKFDVTREEFAEIVRRRCYICKTPPANKVYSSRQTHFAFANGIDRVNSDKGYVAGNLEACCATCNYMKRQMTLREFKQHIAAVVRGMLDV